MRIIHAVVRRAPSIKSFLECFFVLIRSFCATDERFFEAIAYTFACISLDYRQIKLEAPEFFDCFRNSAYIYKVGDGGML